jgi:hypothetical protein
MPGALCPDCGLVLHPLLIAIGRRWHWLCGPPPDPSPVYGKIDDEREDEK